jgi:ribosome biogenesis GTPase A
LQESDLELDSYDLFCTIGKKRGMLIGGGEINEDRCAAMLLDELRGGIIGRITLEEPK